MPKTARFSIPAAANDNDPGYGNWTLPALQRAVQGKLMLDAADNDFAAITLGRIWRIFSGEPVVSDDIRAVIEDYPDPEAIPPSHEALFAETVPFDAEDPDTLREMLDIPMKIVWTYRWNRRTKMTDRIAQPFVFLRGKWRPYTQEWGDPRESVTLPPGYRVRPPQIQATRQQLRDMDHLDRNLFREIVGDDVMDTIEHFVEGKNMEEIGEAFGFRGKQAEAVGKDRIRTAVRAAQRAFKKIEAANKAEYWWQAPTDVAARYAKAA